MKILTRLRLLILAVLCIILGFFVAFQRWSFFNEIHSNSLIILAHDHMITEEENRKYQGTTRVLQVTTDYSDWEEGNWKTNMSFGYSSYLENLEYINNLVNNGELILVHDINDLEDCCSSLIPRAILSFEGVYPFEGDITKFSIFYEHGLRQLQLYRQEGPHPDHSSQVIPQNWRAIRAFPQAPITDFGIELIEKCNEYNVAIDLSHIEDFYNRYDPPISGVIIDSILQLSNDPVMFSHRNPITGGGSLSRSIIEKIITDEDGGIICLNFLWKINGQPKPFVASIPMLIEQLQFFKDEGWIDNVGLGGDFFPLEGAEFIMEDISELEGLTRALYNAGFTLEEVQKIYGQNLLSFYNRINDID